MCDHTDDVSDWDLLQLWWAGDERAPDVLCARHQASLRRSVEHHLGHEAADPFLVEDLMQNVWVALLECEGELLRRYDGGRGCLDTYLGLLARRQVLLRRRSEGDRRKREVALEGHDWLDPGADCGLAQAELAEYKQSLTPQENRYFHENLVGDPKDPSAPAITAVNGRQLKHSLRRKWDAHLGNA